MANSLVDKRILVTGSSSGIGRGIAEAFAAQGCHVALHGIETATQIEKLAQEISSKFKVKAFAFSADVSSAEAVEALARNVQEKLGGIDILVNNAGIQHVAPVENFPLAMWEKLLSIHLTAPFLLSQKLIPEMRANRWGRIINIASVHGLIASAHKSAYVSAKHGLVGFTKTLALETAGSGVTCNAICPGWVRTPLVEAQIEARAQSQNISIEKATQDLLGEKQPSKSFVNVDQLGALAVFLASDAASAMTGSILPMDGGWTAQ